MINIYRSLVSLIVLFLMMGCMTTTKTLDSNQSGFTPDYNVLEKRSWISHSAIELFQDNRYLYVQLSYSSEFDGMFSLFNPPDGSSFMVKGDLIRGDGGIIKRVEKSKVKRIEGIIILFFPGDFSNESERTGLIIHSESLKWNTIPEIPAGRFQENESISESTESSQNSESSENSASSKDHGVVKDVVNEEVEISETDLAFRATLPEKISLINIETDGQDEIQSIFGIPGKLTYYANGQRMTMQYPDKFYPIINTQTGRIDELRLHNPGYTNSEGIHVGSSLDDVIDAYGKPESIIELGNLNGDIKSGILYKLSQSSYYLIQDKNIRFFFDELNNVSAMYLLSPNFVNE